MTTERGFTGRVGDEHQQSSLGPAPTRRELELEEALRKAQSSEYDLKDRPSDRGEGAHEWKRIDQEPPPAERPVWLCDGRVMWIGAHTYCGDCWLFGNSYGSIWWNGTSWECDNEVDDDYRPIYWMRLPELPLSTVRGDAGG